MIDLSKRLLVINDTTKLSKEFPFINNTNAKMIYVVDKLTFLVDNLCDQWPVKSITYMVNNLFDW